MGLGIEEDLYVHHLLGVHPHEVSPSEVVKILLGEQHARPGVVDVEKLLEVVETVGSFDFFYAVERNSNSIALRDGEHQLGLEATFDVEVQLGFGQAGDEGRTGSRHGRGFGPKVPTTLLSPRYRSR